MHCLAHNSNSINDVIQQTWKWPLITVTVNFKEDVLLKADFLKIKNTWVSLPHQSIGGLKWNEKIIDWLLATNSFKGKLSLEEFYRAIFFSLNEALNNIKNTVNDQRQLVIQLDSKKILSLKNVSSESKTRLFIRSNLSLSPYIENHKVVSELKLDHCIENQITDFSLSVRRKIRKASENGIEVALGNLKDLDLFYQIYRKRIHQLGSIGLPKTYFRNLFQKKNEAWLKLILASYKGKCIGVAILNINSAYAENLYFATSTRYNYLYTSYALHTKMLELSIESNCEYYSFGRSTINSGVHNFKQQWGGKDKVLNYNYSWDKRSFLGVQKIASGLIKLLPLSFVCLFDNYFSRRSF